VEAEVASGISHDMPSVPFDFRSIFAGVRSDFALEAVANFVVTPEYGRFRYRALKLLSRNDMTGTFRFVDREAVLAAAVLAACDILQPAKVDLLLFPVTPHEFFPFVLWGVADLLGIPVLFFQPSSIAPVAHARSSLHSAHPLKDASSQFPLVAEAARLKSREKLASLANGVDPAYMQRQRQRDGVVAGRGHAWKVLQSTLRWLFTDRFPDSVDLSGHAHRHGILSRALKILLTRSLQRALREKILTLGIPNLTPHHFAVFALQYEPERTSMPEGLPFDFQGDAVITARALVPRETTLVVKEHYSQQSAALRGFLGRSLRFYDLIETLPNTDFAPTADKLIDLVGRAQCVFTLTGTVALEAVLRGTPVAYFGAPWWAGLPGTLRVSEKSTYGEIVSQPLPNAEEVFAFFDQLALREMIPGLAGETIQTTRQRLGTLPEGFAEAEAAAITDSILSVLRSEGALDS
jgi:hypothetical protein